MQSLDSESSDSVPLFFSLKGGENMTAQNEAKIQDKTDTISCPLSRFSRVIHV